MDNKKLIGRLKDIIEELLFSLSITSNYCEHLHHKKSHYHNHKEDCMPQKIIEDSISKAEEFLKTMKTKPL